MGLEQYISAGIGAVLLIIGLLMLLSARVRNILKIKIIDPKLLGIGLVIIGLATGGIAVLLGYLSPAVASVTNVANPQVEATTETVLSYCDYSAGSSSATGVTVRTDPNSNNRIYLDVDESSWNSTNADSNEFNITFNCARSENIQEDGVSEIVVKGAEFKSETSTTDSSTYNVLVTSSTPSTVWSGKYIQTVYVGDNAYATTSNPKERNFLTFAEGEKVLTLGIKGELDRTSYLTLNNYTTKDMTIYERSASGDKAIAYVTVNKVP